MNEMNDEEKALAQRLKEEYQRDRLYEVRLTARRWLRYAEENLVSPGMFLGTWMDYYYLALHPGTPALVLIPKKILVDGPRGGHIGNLGEIAQLLKNGVKLSTRVLN